MYYKVNTFTLKMSPQSYLLAFGHFRYYEHSIDKEKCKATFNIFWCILSLCCLFMLCVVPFYLMPSTCYKLYIMRCLDLCKSNFCTKYIQLLASTK